MWKLEIGLYIKVVKHLYSMTLEALEALFVHKTHSKALKVALKPFCVVGALTLSAFYGYCVCCFLAKSISTLEKEKEWVDIEIREMAQERILKRDRMQL